MSLYKSPPPATQILCLDEMGPIGVRTYFAPRWSPEGQRPHVTADYGVRGKLWTFGAFEPATGWAVTHHGAKRDTANFLQLLDLVVDHWPTGTLILILDNLSAHKALDVRLWALAQPRVHFLFQPTYSPWLNLIEPWWKTLRSLSLKGRRFELLTELQTALEQATAYWNAHRHPFLWRKAA